MQGEVELVSLLLKHGAKNNYGMDELFRMMPSLASHSKDDKEKENKNFWKLLVGSERFDRQCLVLSTLFLSVFMLLGFVLFHIIFRMSGNLWCKVKENIIF